MSRLEQAGDSNTVSPVCANRAAARTASSMLVARAVWQMPASAVSMSPASRPNNTVVRTLPRKASASGVKSWPLPSPPAMTTSGPARPPTAASVAPTLVPFESLM
jgi:hypothetical protein